VLLFLIDGTSPTASQDLETLAEELRLHNEALADKPAMTVVNKLDLLTEDEIDTLRSQGFSVFVSALDGDGIKDLVRSLVNLVADVEEDDDGRGEKQ
jgi:GTP-binding protein